MDVDMHDASSSAPKRKRLAKACDACHKSKRRCDGTSPCSNCFYARKECSYTDSAGRPVPAPRSAGTSSQSMPEIPRAQSPSHSSAGSSSPHSARTRRPGYSYGPPAPPLVTLGASASRVKRPRLEPPPLSDFVPPPHLSIPPAIPAQQVDKPSASLEPSTVRELAALFFAHTYPARMVFHAPSFNARLTSGRVPTYLLHAICAAAAPLSPHRPQGSAPRAAGMEHAIAAQAMLIAERGVLKINVGTGVEVAQALCLLMYHEHIAAFPWKPSVDCFDLAQQLLNDHLLFNPALSAMDAEIARRCAWFIRFTYINNLQNHSVATPPQPGPGPRVPLPQDETSFEMEVNGAALEYFHLPPPPENQSEFAHVLRTTEMHYAINNAVHKFDSGQLDRAGLQAAADAAQKELRTWESYLSPSIIYSPAAVDIHLALFDTGSNSTAWCFFNAHLVNAASWLALISARKRLGQPFDVPWAQARLLDIVVKLGRRASYNVLGVVALKTLEMHCEDSRLSHQAQFDELTNEFLRTWGARIPGRPFTVQLAPHDHHQQQPASLRPSPSPSGPGPSTSAASSLRGDGRTSAPVSAGAGGGGFFRSLGLAYSGIGLNGNAGTSSRAGSAALSGMGANGNGSAVLGGMDSLGLYDSTADSFAHAGEEALNNGAPPPPVSAFQSTRLAPPLTSQTWRPSWIAPVEAVPALAPSTAARPYPQGPRSADLRKLRLDTSGGSSHGPKSALDERFGVDMWGADKEQDKDETGSVCSLPSLKASGLLECGDAGPARRIAPVAGSSAGGSTSANGLGLPRGMEWLDSRGAPGT
ncbi:hypothetical protein PENSPDRAFT_145988 [Peniophora sp. CONT]|nr:hypothetical protein PENSPDRAFT_145988 [Peniophora sp. CONT]